MSLTGKIYASESFGTVDGPGIRFVLFLQGCPLRCIYCHNADSIPTNGGTEMTVDQVIEQILSFGGFIKNGGVTFSGGEPLMQPKFLLETITRLKKLGFHTAIDTSGAIISESAQQCLLAADLVLLDIKSIDDEMCQKITGKSCLNTFKTLDFCEQNNKDVWIRHVLLPEYTLNDIDLKATADYLSHYNCVKKIELLPFHKMGENKWDKDYILHDTREPTPEEVEKAKSFFKKWA